MPIFSTMPELPLIVRIPVLQTKFDADAVDAEVHCVNLTLFQFTISTSSESFTTIDEETGTTASHGSAPGMYTLAPGQSALVAVVKGWEWDGHVGLQITFQREGLNGTLRKSYDLKSGSADFTMAATGKKGRIISPL